MASFTIVGPFVVPVVVGRGGGRVIDRSRLAEFWADANCGRHVGCYVFGIRSGRGTLPYYAGRTTNSFEGEAFQPHKITKYNEVLIDVVRGTAVMYFAVLDRSRGPRNETAVIALEERLIGLGMQRNPNMANVSGTREDAIIVHGVMGPRRGRPTVPASAFKAMMGVE
jgi:hypothetical protein